MMDRHIKAPLNDDEVKILKAGDYVYISGTIYTARDAAHKRMYEALQNGQEVPMPLKNNIVYYMGPSPAREGRPIGSAGPTTSSRMDKYAPLLMDQGLKGMIGKGKRSAEVREAIVRNGAVYFAAVGGAGALLSKAVKKAEVIAYDDLGTEAIRKLEVENLPAIVVIDSEGSYLYEDAAKLPDRCHDPWQKRYQSGLPYRPRQIKSKSSDGYRDNAEWSSSYCSHRAALYGQQGKTH